MSGNGDNMATFFKVTKEDVEAVSVAQWKEMFAAFCPRTHLLQITPEVLKYLKSDGMVMPQNTPTTAQRNNFKQKGESLESEDDDSESWASVSSSEELPSAPSQFLQNIGRRQNGTDDRRMNDIKDDDKFERGNGYSEEKAIESENYVFQERRNSVSSSDEDEDEDDGKSLEVDKFYEFDSYIEDSIEELGGAVIAKLNRKSPKDAAWIGFNRSLKCYSSGDIYILLKTSDIVGQILEDPYKGCENEEEGAHGLVATTTPYFLVLKEWDDSWGPEMEFRCFVFDNQLIAISQRDMDTCHSSIVKRKDKLLVNIQNFFLRNIQGRLPLNNYVIDIICHPNGEMYLVDVDVLGLDTDPLLFDYEELKQICCENGFGTSSKTGDGEDNEVNESVMPTGTEGEKVKRIQPCLRFLTESRNFRARKTGEHSALAEDVMTYMRECAATK